MFLELPKFIILAIIVKISPEAFVRLMKSCKIVHEFIEQNRRKIRIHSQINLSINLRKDFAPWLAESQLKPDELIIVGRQKISILFTPNCLELSQLGYFKFNDIQLIGHTEELLEQLEKFPPRCDGIFMERYQDIKRTLRLFKPEKVRISSYARSEKETDALPEIEDLRNISQFIVYDAYKHFNSQKVANFLEHSAPHCQYFKLDCTTHVFGLQKSISYVIERMLKDPNCRLKELMIKHGMGEHFDLAEYFPSAKLCDNLEGICFWSLQRGEIIISIVQKKDDLLCTVVSTTEEFKASYIKTFCPDWKRASGLALIFFYLKHIKIVGKIAEKAFSNIRQVDLISTPLPGEERPRKS